MCQNLTGLSLSISVLLYGRINLSDLKQLRSDRSKGIVLANLSPITRTEQSAATLAATLSAYLRRPQYETALLPHNSDLRPFTKAPFNIYIDLTEFAPQKCGQLLTCMRVHLTTGSDHQKGKMKWITIHQGMFHSNSPALKNLSFYTKKQHVPIIRPIMLRPSLWLTKISGWNDDFGLIAVFIKI